MPRELWIFGYGSLMWRPGFAHRERRPGFVAGFARRFWQGSTDHRGVPGAPGRVVTLVPEREAVCWGVAFRVDPRHRASVLARLDHRERGGFTRAWLELRFRAPARRRVWALAYVAETANSNYLGEAPLEAIAEQVRASRGPSGSNADYALRLARTLRALGVRERHVEALAERLPHSPPEGPPHSSPEG